MMFTNIYVHILEVLAALLVVATAVQLFRCYRSSYKAHQTSNALTSVTANIPKNIEKSHRTSGNILHDYIGEFFTDETIDDETVGDGAIAGELKTYQNAEVINLKSISHAKLTAEIIKVATEKEVILENLRERSNIFSLEGRADVTPDITFSQEDEDTVITVMTSSNSPASIVDDKVMSDKVVHAMLDEAKLVCAP
jgi:hypothetical protein